MIYRACLVAALGASIVAIGDRASRTESIVVLWAWERPERLGFIDVRGTEVAFLAATIRLEPGRIEVRPRLQPLEVPPGTRLTSVVRIESHRALATVDPAEEVLDALDSAGRIPGIQALQIDFDARQSDRQYYARLLVAARARLPSELRLSMTALASWCLGDPWIEGLPIDEAVPMLFRMGRDSRSVRRHLANGGEFSLGLCRGSVGISTDEPIPGLSTRNKRYVFNPQPWTSRSVAAVLRRE